MQTPQRPLTISRLNMKLDLHSQSSLGRIRWCPQTLASFRYQLDLFFFSADIYVTIYDLLHIKVPSSFSLVFVCSGGYVPAPLTPQQGDQLLHIPHHLP